MYGLQLRVSLRAHDETGVVKRVSVGKKTRGYRLLERRQYAVEFIIRKNIQEKYLVAVIGGEPLDGKEIHETPTIHFRLPSGSPLEISPKRSDVNIMQEARGKKGREKEGSENCHHTSSL